MTPGLRGTLNEVTQAQVMVSRTGSGVKLSTNPKDLYIVWKEWEFGLNGVKPTKDFTFHEGRANKFSYCRHKFFGLLSLN